jgi:hypothetical protein
MNKQYEIVVASYKEPMNWLRHLPKEDDRQYKLTVSNSNNRDSIPFADRTTLIENAGREAGHYLRFIIDNYDDLLPVTVFLQADPWPHSFSYVDDLLEILYGTPNFEHPMCYLGATYGGGGVPVQKYTLTDHILRLGWGSTPYPAGTPIQIGAQFYVKKDTILKRPKEHYEGIYSASFDPDISLGHALEGHWGRVFDH